MFIFGISTLMLFIASIILILSGTVTSTVGGVIVQQSCPQCLYIGLPIVFYIWSLVIYYAKENQFIQPLHSTKSGVIWDKYPYIVWILGNMLKFLTNMLLPLTLPLTFSYDICKFIWHIGQTMVVIVSLPDSKAENRIKQIWDK